MLLPDPGSKWTTHGWLASQDVLLWLAAALLGEDFDGDDELEKMRALGRSNDLEQIVTERVLGFTAPLVDILVTSLRNLATCDAATSSEMQTKFAQDVKGMLNYAGLNLFFGGLEQLVGSPSPNVLKICFVLKARTLWSALTLPCRARS